MALGSANCFRVMLIVQGLDISCSLEQVLSLWLPFIFQDAMFKSLLTVQDSAVNCSTEAISGSDLFLCHFSSLSLFDLTAGL